MRAGGERRQRYGAPRIFEIASLAKKARYVVTCHFEIQYYMPILLRNTSPVHRNTLSDYTASKLYEKIQNTANIRLCEFSGVCSFEQRLSNDAVQRQ